MRKIRCGMQNEKKARPILSGLRNMAERSGCRERGIEKVKNRDVQWSQRGPGKGKIEHPSSWESEAARNKAVSIKRERKSRRRKGQ